MSYRSWFSLGLVVICSASVAVAYRWLQEPDRPTDAIQVENPTVLVEDLPVWQARDVEVRVRNEGPEALEIIGLAGC
jgi:hypothetical protein